MRLEHPLNIRVILLIAALSCMSPASASRLKPASSVAVLVTFEGVSLDQLIQWNIPGLQPLLRSGAIGLMNIRTAGRLTPAGNAVTIGAGSRARGNGLDRNGSGNPAGNLGFDVHEKAGPELAGQVYESVTGIRAPSSGVVQNGIAALRNANSKEHYAVIPGLLSSQLETHGVTVAVYGNGDCGRNISRTAVAIAMNEQGRVPIGDVGPGTLIHDPAWPFGVRTNYSGILDRIRDLRAPRAFVVVDAGDGARVVASEGCTLPVQYDHLHRLATAGCLQFLLRLRAFLRAHSRRYLLLFAVTSPDPEAASRGDLLTPVYLDGAGAGRGLASSATTKRQGLLANVDLAPTVLGFFGVRPPPSMVGQQITSEAASSPLATLQATNDQIVATDDSRTPILRGYIYFLSLSVVLYVLVLLAWKAHAPWAQSALRFRRLRTLFIAIMLAPLAMLVAPGVGIYTTVASGAFVLVSTITAALPLDYWVRDFRLLYACIGIPTALVIVADILARGPLLQKSLLSYSAITGARYYGIGNEYTGVLLGATLLGMFSLLDYLSKRPGMLLIPVCAVYLLVLVLVGGPQFGTKFGGIIAAIIGFSVALVKMRGGRVRGRDFLWPAMGGAGLFALMLGMNMLLSPDKQTHIGRIFWQARSGGLAVLVDAALRKWQMNLNLIRYSRWAIALESLCFGLIALCYRPFDTLRQTLADHCFLNAGFSGILAFAAIGLVTNDAGVVLAATGLLYLVFPLILLVEGKRGTEAWLPDKCPSQGT